MATTNASRRVRRSRAPTRPAADRPKRRQWRITPVGWAYLVVCAITFAAALIREINVLMVLFSMLGAMLLLNVRFALVGLRGAAARRAFPPRVAADQEFDVELTLANWQRQGGSWVVEVEDRLQRVAPRVDAEQTTTLLFNRVAADSSQTGAYRLALMERGKYRFGQLRVSTCFPLGLIRRSLWFEAPGELLVLPRVGRLSPNWFRQQAHTWESARHAQHRLGVLQGEYHGLREWRAGDSRRWIHWRTSARQNALFVRQFEQQEEQNLCVLLDLSGAGDREHLEIAIQVAATIVSELQRHGGARLSFGMTGAAFPVARGPVSGPLVNEVLEALAVAEPAPAGSLAGLIQAARGELREATGLTLLTTRPVDEAEIHARGAGRDVRLSLPIRIVDVSSPSLGELWQPQ